MLQQPLCLIHIHTFQATPHFWRKPAHQMIGYKMIAAHNTEVCTQHIISFRECWGLQKLLSWAFSFFAWHGLFRTLKDACWDTFTSMLVCRGLFRTLTTKYMFHAAEFGWSWNLCHAFVRLRCLLTTSLWRQGWSNACRAYFFRQSNQIWTETYLEY